MGSAAERWAAALREWKIPDDILSRAPRSPWGFPVGLFSKVADDALGQRTPTVERADEALPDGGVVLDVGCGAGAASLPLASRSSRLIGVDEQEDMLAAFAERGERLGVETVVVQGRWPDVAGDVGIADVTVCRNVAYNVADLDGFAAALTDHTRERVVLELTECHPLAWTNPFWEEVHGVQRPERPTVEDAVAVLNELGLEPAIERWEASSSLMSEGDEAIVEFLVVRLCLPDDRADEVRAVLRDHPPPRQRQVATVWWPP